jgi:hypothetical protein
MKAVSRMFLTALLAVGLSAGGAQAEVTVSVVHGVPDATVDVYVNGGLLLPMFEFGTVTDELTVPAGTYDVEVYLAGQSPSTTDAIISLLGADLPDGINVTLVAHLDEEGTPIITPFVNDLASLGSGSLLPGAAQFSRVTVRHTAAAPKVLLTIGSLPRVTLANQQDVTFPNVRSNTYWVWLAAAANPAAGPVFGPVTLPLEPNVNTVVYAVGDIGADNFTVLVQTFDLP